MDRLLPSIGIKIAQIVVDKIGMNFHIEPFVCQKLNQVVMNVSAHVIVIFHDHALDTVKNRLRRVEQDGVFGSFAVQLHQVTMFHSQSDKGVR